MTRYAEHDHYAGPNGEYFDPRVAALMLDMYAKLYDIFDGDIVAIEQRVHITNLRIAHRLMGGCQGDGQVLPHGRFVPNPKPAVTTTGRPAISRRVRDAVFKRDGFRCRLCDSIEFVEIDHIHPVSKGGGNEIENLQLLCRACNRAKHNHTPDND